MSLALLFFSLEINFPLYTLSSLRRSTPLYTTNTEAQHQPTRIRLAPAAMDGEDNRAAAVQSLVSLLMPLLEDDARPASPGNLSTETVFSGQVALSSHGHQEVLSAVQDFVPT